MKKEVILAIVIGVGLGLVITFGIWIANRSLKNLDTSKPQATDESVITNTPTPAPSPSSASESLTITSPDNEALLSDPNVKITGSTIAGNTVIILHENGQDSVVADSSGNFSDSIKVSGGYNTITVISVSPTGSQTSKTLVVTYTTAKL